MACVTYARAASTRASYRPSGSSPMSRNISARWRARTPASAAVARRIRYTASDVSRAAPAHAPADSRRGREHRFADERQLAEQLQGVPQVLAGSLEEGIALGAAAALQGAAPLGAAPAVHHRATLARRARHGQTPRHGTAVDAVAAVGQQTWDRHDAGNVARPGRASQQAAAAKRRVSPDRFPA